MLSDKPNTFRILTCYYRPKPGGFCKRLFRGIRALLDAGHTVHYLAVVPFPIEHPSCHFHRFPWPEERTSGYLFWGCFHLLAPLMLLWIGFLCRIDRAFAFGHTYALFLQPLRLVKRVPLVLFLRADTVRNHEIKEHAGILIKLEYLLEGFGIVGTSMYVVSETLLKDTLARHSSLLPASSGVLRNEIVTQQRTDEKPREFRLQLRTACVGVLEPRKNQRLLLDVFKKISAEQAQLYLYGTGPDEQLLQETVRKEGMNDRVHFMCWVPSERIWPEVDLLLMPSLHEGAPNAVLEALGHGIPVFASDIPEHAEILPRKYLRSVDSCASWSKLIEEAVRQNNLASIAEDQRNCARKLFFDWDSKFVELIVKQN
ncbi:MAG: glycosyltransferase family 4 protein [Candidatus Electronema sp. V4]|uniref:glycosyltransferase family 4 protein n=1 Tax=Candidatus Electronema sp. V4 TaxID=3454756 RepID=UPI0040557D94